MATTKSSKRKRDLKRKLLAHIAGSKIDQYSHGLLEKAIKAIHTLYDTGDVDNIDKAIDKTLKLLPYVLEKEDTKRLSQMQLQGSGGGQIYLQLNYLSSQGPGPGLGPAISKEEPLPLSITNSLIKQKSE